MDRGGGADARRVRVGIALVVLLVVVTPGAAQPAAPIDTTPGTTPETAIVLSHIADEFHGVVAEHAYIADHFPTWHIEYQTRVSQNDRNYDQLGMLKPDNTKVTIFFDITEWVGK